MNQPTPHFHKGLFVVALVVAVAFWGSFLPRVFAQLNPLSALTSLLPTGNIAFVTSPFVLDTAGIHKNIINNTWDIPYNIPPNINSTNFVLQMNGATLTGIPTAQVLNGQLVFKVPDAAFAGGGTALIGLAQKNPFEVVAVNAVLVLAQGLQPSPYILNQSSIVKNDNGTWDVGYSIPPNTVASNFTLSVGNKGTVSNPGIAYGGMIFKVPESYFESGQTLTLKLTDASSGIVRATNVVTVPESGPSPFTISSSSVTQNPNKTWRIVYGVPPLTVASEYVLVVGTKGEFGGAVIVNQTMVFTIPKDAYTPADYSSLVLKELSTGRYYYTDGTYIQGFTPTTNSGTTTPKVIPLDLKLDTSNITQNSADQSWRIPWFAPANTQSSRFVLVLKGGSELGGGVIVNNSLVYKVPGNLFTIADAPGLILKDITDGTLYHADGTTSQGAVPNSPMSTTKYIGGLLVTFPPDGQNITQTQATIEANIHATFDLPYVDVSYVWNKTGTPSGNVEKSLLKIPGPLGMTAGMDKKATLTFAGLSKGTKYTFVIKNNITGGVSDPIQFTTPSKANEKSYLSYSGGLIDYVPNDNTESLDGNGAVVDTISDVGIVPICGRTLPDDASDELKKKQGQMCGYQDFLQLIDNIIKYAIIIIGPIIAIIAIYNGFVIMFLGRIPDKTTEQMARLHAAMAALVRVGIGIAIMLSAWVIVNTIIKELGVKEAYSLLDLFQ